MFHVYQMIEKVDSFVLLEFNVRPNITIDQSETAFYDIWNEFFNYLGKLGENLSL